MLDEAERGASQDYVDYYAPLLSRIRGTVLDAAGRRSQATDVLDEGIRVATGREDTFELGLLVLTLARVTNDQTDAIALQNATETLRSLGVRSVSGVALDG